MSHPIDSMDSNPADAPQRTSSPPQIIHLQQKPKTTTRRK